MRENFTIQKKSEQLWSDQRSQSALFFAESQNHALPRFWIAAWYTEYWGYFRKRFWTTTCSRRTNLYSLQQFKEFGIRKNKATRKWIETKTEELVNTCTTLPKWRILNHTGETYSHSGVVDFTRFSISELHLGKFPDSMEVGKSTSRLKYVRNQQILISQCTGSKMLR